MEHNAAINLNQPDVQSEARRNVNKRYLIETSPDASEERSTERRKVGELYVDDLRQIIKDSNREVLEKLSTLSGNVEDLKEQNNLLKQEVEHLKVDKDVDRRRINQLEEQIKSKNLILKGLNAKSSVNGVVNKICFDKLKLPKSVKIIYTKKLYERDEKMAVLVELDSSQSVQNALQNAKKLAGTSIYLERDLTPEKQKDKKVMLQLKKDIVAASKSHRIAVINDRIRINDKWFRWNKEKQLFCGQEEADGTFKDLYPDVFDKINFNYNALLERSMSKNL